MKTIPSTIAGVPTVYVAAVAVGVLLLGAYLAKKTVEGAAGLVTGDNFITQNQHNAAGETVTAYQGAGILGTLGAATNSASGGILASVGETLGGWAFDVFGPKTP